ncbi:MAG: hypothetical protein JKY93_03590 [Gammaproteobacteria bacterium]|nr:hypothetical protein [Gammaproteobacteria bacterium]
MAIPIATGGIVDQAFRHMRLSPASSLQDGDEKATAARDQYPTALDYCLELGDWSFASTLADLMVVLDQNVVIDPKNPTAYKLPADCVRLIDVHPIGQISYRLDGDFLRTDNAGVCRVRYTRRINVESNLPGVFKALVSLRLALDLGPRFGMSNTREDRLNSQSIRALKVALRADAKLASARRYDGRDDDIDWVQEARR